jgi:hypothetical protein
VLKYLIATMNTKVDNDLIGIIIKTTFDNILLCISDLDDDVRQVATQTLVPISKHLSGFLSSQHCKQLLKVLIDVLLIVDDLSTSCTSIMELLCDLLEYEANLKSFLNLFDVNEFIKRLYLYIKHSNLNVKQMTLNTFNKIFQIMSRDCERGQLSGVNQNVLQNLFRLLYQQAIIETNLKCLESIESLWLTLCHFIEFNSLIQTCFPYITTWLLLLMYPAQQPIDAVYLIQISDDNDVANTMNSTTKKEYVGGSHLMYEDYKKRDEIIVQCRLYASRLLAVLFNRISNGIHILKLIAIYFTRFDFITDRTFFEPHQIELNRQNLVRFDSVLFGSKKVHRVWCVTPAGNVFAPCRTFSLPCF